MLDKPHPDTAERHSPLDIARAHRAAVQGRIVKLSAERDRLRTAEGAEREARAALDALGREEVAAARAWASEGAPGNAPAVDGTKRAKLTAALVTAEAASAAARGAGAGIDAELADAQQDVVRTGRQIEAVALDTLSAEFLTRWGAIVERAAGFREEIAGALAALSYLRALAEDRAIHGREGDAVALHRRAEPLSRNLGLDLMPTVGETNAHVPAWAARFADLTR